MNSIIHVNVASEVDISNSLGQRNQKVRFPHARLCSVIISNHFQTSHLLWLRWPYWLRKSQSHHAGSGRSLWTPLQNLKCTQYIHVHLHVHTSERAVDVCTFYRVEQWCWLIQRISPHIVQKAYTSTVYVHVYVCTLRMCISVTNTFL